VNNLPCLTTIFRWWHATVASWHKVIKQIGLRLGRGCGTLAGTAIGAGIGRRKAARRKAPRSARAAE
jgi:hypothetical protein